MDEKRYKLRFLPLFAEDLDAITDDISMRLHNPDAARALLDAIQAAINARTTCAEAFEPYPSLRERRYPYYRIYVKNYIIFYVVIGDVMEVRRILYSRRNLRQIL